MKIDPQFLRKPVLLAVAITLLMMGCSGYQYVASPRYVPLNETKGEVTVNVHPSAVQLGYAFTNNFSVFATGFRRFSAGPTANPLPVNGKHHRYGSSKEVNVGFSYFKKTGKFVVEVLAGGGYGDMSFGDDFTDDKHHDEGYQFDMTANRRNFFIQPDIRFKFRNATFNEHFSLAVFTKFNSVRYYNIESELQATVYSRDLDDGIHYFASRQQAALFFIEPGVQIKGGSRNFKAVVQLCPVINASSHALRYQRFSINSGITMNMNLLYRRSNQ